MAFQVFVGKNLPGIGGSVNDLAVARPNDGGDGGEMSAKTGNFLARRDVPDGKHMVGATANELRGVGVEGDSQHLRVVAFKGSKFLLRGDLPHFDQAIATGGRQFLAVTTEIKIVDCIPV